MILIRRLMIVLTLLLPGALHAQSCTFSVGSTDFGAISAIRSEPEDIVGAVSIYCSGYSTPMIRMCLNIGFADQRQLTGTTGEKLNYNLYVDPDHVGIWGSVTAPSTVPLILDLPVHPSGNIWAHEPFYGRIPPNQTVSPGQYSMSFGNAQTYFVYVGYNGTPPDCSTATAPYQTVSFEVQAAVGVDCDITATPLTFPDTGLINRPLSAVSTVDVTCTSGAAFTIELDGGTTPGASMLRRRMIRAGGTDTVDYQLYIDPQHTNIWGDGSYGTSHIAAVGTGTMHSYTVHGRVPAQTSVPAGNYSDVITATVSF
jgi:spore coat protein U-like protein